MRRRTVAFIAAYAAIACVIAFQAVTHQPPEPSPRLAMRPQGPTAGYFCDRDGRLMIRYTTNSGRSVEPISTGRYCSSAAEAAAGSRR